MSKNVLVTYFSATGTTARLAKTLAEAADAELAEIVPAEPYTAADLNWNDSRSRSSVEMKGDRSYRPAIAETVANMDDYDVVYVGFPIWWYVAPTIVNTFLEAHDLTGKTVVPFATSGGSGMGSTNTELAPSCPGARLLAGKRFSASTSAQDLRAWIDTLDL